MLYKTLEYNGKEIPLLRIYAMSSLGGRVMDHWIVWCFHKTTFVVDVVHIHVNIIIIYIFHLVTNKAASEKKYRYQELNVWFLKYGWKKLISSSSEGTVWLRSVSTLNDGWIVMLCI